MKEIIRGQKYLDFEDLKSGKIEKWGLGEKRRILESKIFIPQEYNIQKNAYPFGREPNETPVKEILVTLQQAGLGWYSVVLYTNPYFGNQEIYRSDPKSKSHKETSKNKFDGLVKLLENGNYKIYISPGASKETASTHIALEILKENIKSY